MMKYSKILFVLILLFVFQNVDARVQRRINNFMSYKAKVHEIGTGFNIAYLRNRKYIAPSVHLHYSRYLTDYFSLGVGYETIFDNRKHNAFTFEASIKFLDGFLFTVKPGFTTKEINNEINLLYILGVETAYEFQVTDNVHIGPMLEFNSIQNDLHVLGGIHLGFNF